MFLSEGRVSSLSDNTGVAEELSPTQGLAAVVHALNSISTDGLSNLRHTRRLAFPRQKWKIFLETKWRANRATKGDA
jgi:hypothetical protein